MPGTRQPPVKWDKLFKGGDDSSPEGWEPPPRADSGWSYGSPAPSGFPPPSAWDQTPEDWRPPVPGEIIPAGNSGLTFRPPGETKRQIWEARHTAWLEENGLSYAPEQLRAWWETPGRDNIPMPGLMEYQRRLIAQECTLEGMLGQARDGGPAQDPRVSAERVEWLENALTRAAAELAEGGAERDRLTSQVARQEEIVRQQAALIEQHKADTGRHRAEIGRLKAAADESRSELAKKDAATARQKSTIDELNAAIKAKDSEIERQAAVAGRQRVAAGEWRAVIDRQETQLGEKAAEIERKNAEIERLESELDQRRVQPVQPQDAGAGYRESVAGYEERLIARQKAKITALESRIRDLESGR